MKKVIASVLSLAMIAALATGCDTKPTDTAAPSNGGNGGDPAPTDNGGDPTEATTTEKQTMTFGTGSEKINLWSFTDEIPKMVGQYVKQKPEFGDKYTVECTIIATDGGAYQTALDNALVAGGDTAPDMYAAEAAFILKYSQGDMAKFASTYKDLGIDVDAKIKEADIAKYTIEVGSRNGDLVALGYQATGCAMIYNAEVAKDALQGGVDINAVTKSIDAALQQERQND